MFGAVTFAMPITISMVRSISIIVMSIAHIADVSAHKIL